MAEERHYAALGLSPGASQGQVERRYRALARLLDDASADRELEPWAERQLALVERAYRALGRPGLRGASEPPRSEPATPGAEAAVPPPRRPRLAAAPRLRGGPLAAALGGAMAGLVILLVIWVVAGAPWSGGQGASPLAQGGVDAAQVARLQDAVSRDPKDVGALFDLGETYFSAGEWSQAIAWFERLLALDPANAHALNDVALANYYLGRYPEARSTWDRALALAPDDEILHYSMGFFLRNTPPYDTDQARAHFRRTIELAPDSDIAQSAKDQIGAMDAAAQGATPGAGSSQPQ